MNAADLPYETSTNALIEIEANASIRSAYDKFIVPNALAIYALDYLDKGQKSYFDELLKLKTTDSSILFRGLIVQSCSVFEYFCKRTIEGIVQERATAATVFDDLAPELVISNFAYTGLYFQKSRDGYVNGTKKAKYQELSDGLVTCRPGSGPFTLNASVFTEYLGNCTPTQLESRFREMGLEAPFGDALGAFSELRTHFGGGGAREVAKKAKQSLHGLLERRNSLVHSSTISERVTIDEVSQACKLVQALMGGIRQMVRAA